MRTLGLLGGITYHATALYYTRINEYIQKKLGGGHSAKIVMHSFDFAEVISHYHAGDFTEFSRQLAQAGKNLSSIGAEAIVLCVNTSHMWADDIEKAAGIPLLHIIDYTGEAIRSKGLKTIALLGTQPTMEEDFIKGRLEVKYGLKVLVPEETVRKQMDEIIFKDLPEKIVTEQTKALYLETVKELEQQGAEGIILGCTELQFVLMPGDVEVPLFDTVSLHADGVAQWAIE